MGYIKQGFKDGMTLNASHLEAIEDAIIALEEQNGVNITDKFSWTPGTIAYANGSISVSDTNWLYSDFVDVSEYKQIKFSHIQTSNATTSLGYAFYDESKKYISGSTNGGSSYVPIDKVIDVPSGAKYFRCMWINTTNTNYSASIHEISNFYCYGGNNFTISGNNNSNNSSSNNTSTSTTTSDVPSHWVSHLKTKVDEINTLSETYGGKADCFIFITDQHKNTGAGNDGKLINYIIENTSIKKVFFGGDIVQGSNTDKKIFRDYRKELTKDSVVFPMRGNHDTWGNSTETDFWDIWVRPLENVAEISDKLWFYYDNKAQKIRYIITDSTYASADGDSNLTSPEQISWMQERIKELSDDWTCLVLHHGVWTASKDATMPINKDGQLMIDSINEIYDESKCKIAGLYVGHCHRDYNTTTEKGYLLVGTTLDCYNSGQASYDINFPTRTKNTTTEHAFDVVFFIPSEKKIKTIRIGAGVNREFLYS